MTRRAAWREAVVHGALIAAFVAISVQQLVAPGPISFPDTTRYLAKGSGPVLTRSCFWREGRLFAVPLLWSPGSLGLPRCGAAGSASAGSSLA